MSGMHIDGMVSLTIIVMLVLFQVKHFVFDWLYQTPNMLVGKGIYGNKAGIAHSALHAFGTWVVLLPFVIFHWAIILAILEGLVHYHIDYIKARFGTKDASTPKFWAQLGLDQYAHQVTYLALVLVIITG